MIFEIILFPFKLTFGLIFGALKFALAGVIISAVGLGALYWFLS
jgi:hypothetical protein